MRNKATLAFAGLALVACSIFAKSAFAVDEASKKHYRAEIKQCGTWDPLGTPVCEVEDKDGPCDKPVYCPAS